MPEKLERKYCPFAELKITGDENGGPGGFEGHTSISGNLDDGGDIILGGSFKDVLAAFLKTGFTAHSHDWNIADGVIGYPMKAHEDDDGLFVAVKFHSTQDAQNVRTKMRERLADGKEVGLSIGYRSKSPIYIYPKDYEKELPKYLSAKYLKDGLEKAKQFKHVRVLPAMQELKECSVVTSAMNQDSQVTDVKDNITGAEPPVEAKVGARNNATDTRKIQSIHDMATELEPSVCSGYSSNGKGTVAQQAEAKSLFDDELADITEVEPWNVWQAFANALQRIKAIKKAAGTMQLDTVGMLDAALGQFMTELRPAALAEIDEDDDDDEISPYALYGRAEAPERKAEGTIGGVKIDDLPDSSFAYIESGGKKDDDGRTTPRSLRHYPYKDKDGTLDATHVRNALARLGDPKNEQGGKDKIEAAAKKLKIGDYADGKKPAEKSNDKPDVKSDWEREKFRTQRFRTNAFQLKAVTSGPAAGTPPNDNPDQESRAAFAASDAASNGPANDSMHAIAAKLHMQAAKAHAGAGNIEKSQTHKALADMHNNIAAVMTGANAAQVAGIPG